MKRNGFAITALMVVVIGLAGGIAYAQNNTSENTDITTNKAVNNIESANFHCDNNEEVTKADSSHCNDNQGMMGDISSEDMVKMHNSMMGYKSTKTIIQNYDKAN